MNMFSQTVSKIIHRPGIYYSPIPLWQNVQGLKPGRLTNPPPGETYSGKCVGVTDGDTITVMQAGRALKILLGGIDCPEHRTVDPKVGGSIPLTHPT